jgi:hypothetical protein
LWEWPSRYLACASLSSVDFHFAFSTTLVMPLHQPTLASFQERRIKHSTTFRPSGKRSTSAPPVGPPTAGGKASLTPNRVVRLLCTHSGSVPLRRDWMEV